MRRLALALIVLLAVGASLWTLLAGGADVRTVANRAFPSPKASRTAVVWAVGDGASGTAVARRLAKRIARDRPLRVLYLGDVYESGTARQFRRHMAGDYGSLVERMLPTPGNHEWGNRTKGYDAFWKRVTGHATPPWYRLRIAGWDVLSLNSEAPHARSTAQGRWLRRAVGRPGTCRLAFWHRPRWSAGRHGDQGDVAPLWTALRGRAALVLGGHDHDLQRFKRRDGIVELVSGAGGRDRYAVHRDPRLAWADDEHFGAVRIALSPGAARVRFVDSGGRVLDRSTVQCRK
jgi:hypothetical protein